VPELPAAVRQRRGQAPQCQVPQCLDPSLAVPQDLYVSPRVVQIVGIPDHLQSPETLTKPQFLGQYGHITKMAFGDASNGPALGAVLPISGSVFVQFATPDEARSCILSINGHRLGSAVIEATFAIVEICHARRAKRAAASRTA
jgi:hypothetical protein